MNAEFQIRGRTIETPRLLLRPFRPEDLEDFFAYASVPGVGEMAGWPHHRTREDTRAVLETFIAEDKTFALCLREGGRVIGSLGVEKYGREEDLTEFLPYRGRELGFVLARDLWGLGLMPEAVWAVVGFLFGEEGLDFLLCGYYDCNAQSRRVQEKCGFRPYRKLQMQTFLGHTEPGVLNLLQNPARPARLVFSHPETLIWEQR